MKLTQLTEAKSGESETGTWIVTDSNLILTHFDVEDDTFIITPKQAASAIQHGYIPRSRGLSPDEFDYTNSWEVEEYDSNYYAILANTTIGREFVDVEYHVPKQILKDFAKMSH